MLRLWLLGYPSQRLGEGWSFSFFLFFSEVIQKATKNEVDYEDYFITMQVLVIGDLVINEGDWISLNGSTGEVILGKQPLSPPALSGDLEIFMSWADQLRRLKVIDSLHKLPTSSGCVLFLPAKSLIILLIDR